MSEEHIPDTKAAMTGAPNPQRHIAVPIHIWEAIRKELGGLPFDEIKNLLAAIDQTAKDINL